MNAQLLEKLKELTQEEKHILEGDTNIDRAIYKESKSMVIDSKKLLDSGKLIDVRPHTRFIHYPKHTHNYVEIVYMCEGQTDHIINDQPVRLEKGELLFLHQNTTQEIMKANQGDIAVNFIILPEFFDQALTMIGEEENMIRDFLISCLQGRYEDIPYLHFKVSQVLPIQNLVENLIWTIVNEQQQKRSINQVTMGLLFLQLMAHTDKVVTGVNNYEADLMFSVYNYINEHYNGGQLQDLADLLGVELYQLSRMIKKVTGLNYKELLQNKRLSQAAYLLKSTNMKVIDIGFAVGYSNLSYFYRIFRERYGVSPKHFRK